MAYPFLPVNPCCTDVVLNSPCGCGSTISNCGCNNNSCGTNLTASSTIVYDGPALSCTTAEPCDTLNVILEKIDSIICNLLTQINILTIQINNITTEIINIEGDIINIYNQLGECCTTTTSTSSSSTSTTSSTTTVHPCENFSLTNTGEDPVAIIITDCDTGEPEAIILNPGDTNICVITDSPLTVPGTIIVTPNGPCETSTTTTTSSSSTSTTSTSSTSSTTTTTTTAIPCECLTFENTDDITHTISYNDCDGVTLETEILANETLQFCGCCGSAGSALVFITIGANCVNGLCPGISTTTTTTTAYPFACSCLNVSISQIDLDDATGNTIVPGKANNTVYLRASKGSACGGGDIDTDYTIAGDDVFCIDLAVALGNIALFYYKDDVPIYFPTIDSTYTILYSNCSVSGDCDTTTTTTSSSSSTTTTSTTAAPNCEFTGTATQLPECTRPEGLITVNYFNTYTYDDIQVDYTGSLLDACAACNFIKDNALDIQQETSLFGQSAAFGVGELVYAGIGTSCNILADGFYITDHETCEITEILNEEIESITNCELTPTTTTTTTITPTSTTTTTVGCTGVGVTINGIQLTLIGACTSEPISVTVYVPALPIVEGTQLYNDQCLTETFTFGDPPGTYFTNINGNPYTINPSGVILSVESCITTTTTTTTAAPTTTSTTTSTPSPQCYNVEVYPPVFNPGTFHTVEYLDCLGDPQTVNVPDGGSMVPICATEITSNNNNGATNALLTPCIV
jgi:hypothetical protein